MIHSIHTSEQTGQEKDKKIKKKWKSENEKINWYTREKIRWQKKLFLKNSIVGTHDEKSRKEDAIYFPRKVFTLYYRTLNFNFNIVQGNRFNYTIHYNLSLLLNNRNNVPWECFRDRLLWFHLVLSTSTLLRTITLSFSHSYSLSFSILLNLSTYLWIYFFIFFFSDNMQTCMKPT